MILAMQHGTCTRCPRAKHNASLVFLERAEVGMGGCSPLPWALCVSPAVRKETLGCFSDSYTVFFPEVTNERVVLHDVLCRGTDLTN